MLARVSDLSTDSPESVWSYPRPPRVETEARQLRIFFGGTMIAETRAALRVLETSHPPTYYLPREAFADGVLHPASGESICEWKGTAAYFTVVSGRAQAVRAAWSYPAPTEAFAALAGHVAVYAHAMDVCWVGEHRVDPQPGGFYGGWVTDLVAGPFKGGPGTLGW